MKFTKKTAKEYGSRGGIKTKRKYGKKYFSAMAIKMHRNRKAKAKLNTKHHGDSEQD